MSEEVAERVRAAIVDHWPIGFDDGYVDSYYTIIKGISPLPVRRKGGPWGYDQQTRYEAVGRIETPEGGLGIVKEFEYLKAHTMKATKATCARTRDLRCRGAGRSVSRACRPVSSRTPPCSSGRSSC